MHTKKSFAISVVIPCRGPARELESCLRGLVGQTLSLPYEIIVVVDSRSDPTVAKVVATFHNVRLVHSLSILLPGGARNLGAYHARSEYLAFIDADCIPESDWITAAIAALNAGATMVGGPVLDAYPLHPIAVADNLLQFVDFPPNRSDGTAAYLPGCNFALSKPAFHELGGFHNDVAAGEDVLFNIAATQRWPRDVRFVRDMRVRHRGRTHLREFWYHQETFGFYRGYLALWLRPIYRLLGCQSVMVIPVVCMRLRYIMFRTAQWNPAGLLHIVLLLPILLFGLTAWAKGFCIGCRKSVEER